VAERERGVKQRYCGNCGSELREGDRYCGKCGSPVHATARVPTPEADVPTPPPPPSEQRRRRVVGYTILGVVLLVAGLLCAAFIGLALLALALGGPIPNMALVFGFFGVLAAATLFGAWRLLK
jgi:hypothetical protein